MVDAVVVLRSEAEVRPMPRSYKFVKLDVFTTVAFEGNPLAVFPDAQGLDDATMQRIACELNLSETTFVFPPANPQHTALVRIFTPRSELPFASHPTVGTAFVLRGDGNAEALVLEEGVGPVPVRVARDAAGTLQFWLTTPPIAFGERIDPAIVTRALGLRPSDIQADAPPEVASAGAPFVFVALKNRDLVDRIERLDYRALRAALPNAPTEVFVFARREDSDGQPGDTYAVYSRMFAPEIGIAEDPATGGATGPLAAYMLRHGLLPLANGLHLVSEQGTKMGRRSLLHVLIHTENDALSRIEVGGSVVPIATGEMTL
jgi:trans-2,3-dihydro-3-hydroxyanthranilate isomerase